MQKRAIQAKPIEGKFAASIILDESKFGKQDVDNGIKVLLDYAQRVKLITNDKNCYSLSINWGAVEGAKLSIIELPDA